jgi:curved DNA-binding protein CbpA
MALCVCGNAADDSSTMCPRCTALQTLELKYGATGDEIKAAHLLLVKVWHPDRFANDAKLKEAADEKLKAINAAYLLLTSSSGKEARKRWSRRAAPGDAQHKPGVDAAAPAHAESATRAGTGRVRNLLLTVVALGATQRLIILAGGIGASALFARFVDSQLASDPATAQVYLEYRQAIVRQVDSSRTRIFDQMQQSLRSLNPFRSAASGPTYSSPQTNQLAPPAPTPTTHAEKKVQRPTIRLMPYITVGLTQDEVIAIAGTPVSASADTLTYKGAEIDFSGGHVNGWKIDPVTSPLRVKLWPDAPVDTSEQYFSVGSTKNDVLVIQGTPTSFSEDKFAYGASEVYFQDNRVVRWKNDPTSVPLRVVPR